jgi:hypothetical protein
MQIPIWRFISLQGLIPMIFVYMTVLGIHRLCMVHKICTTESFQIKIHVPWAVEQDSSHELAEAVTDPTGEGWMDRTIGAEIADLCWDNGTTIGSDGKVYVIQKLWSNTAGKCVSGLMFPTNRPTKKPIRKSPTKKK